MTTFVSLINLTDQGIRNVKESPNRFEAFKNMAAKHGVTVKAVYYTVGEFDMIVIVEGNEQSVIASLLADLEVPSVALPLADDASALGDGGLPEVGPDRGARRAHRGRHALSARGGFELGHGQRLDPLRRRL